MDILRRTKYLAVATSIRKSCRQFRTKTISSDSWRLGKKISRFALYYFSDTSSSETVTGILKRLLAEHCDQERLLAIGGIATAYMWNVRRTILEEWDITEGEFVARLTKKIRDEGKKVALYYDCRDFAPAEMEPPDESESDFPVKMNFNMKGKGKKVIEVDEETLNKQQERLSVKVVITDRNGHSIVINCVCTSGSIGFEEMGIIDDDVDFNNLLLEGGTIPDEKIRRIGIRRLPAGFHDALFRYAEDELNFTVDLVTYVCLNASLHRRKKQIEFLQQIQDVI